MAVSRARSSRMPSMTDRSLRQRVRPPRLAEAANQRRVARLEEDQRGVEAAASRRSCAQDLRELRQERSARARRRRSRPSSMSLPGPERQLGERRDQQRSAGCRRRSSRGPRAPGSPATSRRPTGRSGRRSGCRRRPAARRRPLRARASRVALRPVVPIGLGTGLAGVRLPELAFEARRQLAGGVVAARPQELVARRHLDEDRRRCAPAPPACGSAGPAGPGSRSTRRRGPAARTRGPAPSARAARPARPASTSASRRRRTGPGC